jgi:predicted MFS family arabinose efflux permease
VQRFAEVIAPSRLGRSFRWLLASSWVTNLGDGITLAAGPLLVASQTRDPLAVAMAAFLQRLPWLLFGLYAGVVAHASIWGTTSMSVRQRAVPAQFQGRVGSVYLTGVVGGIVIGSALGGLVASAWGVTAPFWFAFAGSALILTLIWRSLLQIAHADEQTRASAPTGAA